MSLNALSRLIYKIKVLIKDRNFKAIILSMRKLLSIFFRLLFAPIGLIFAIIIRIIRPWVIIRLDILQSSRIGHFATNTELYLCELDNGLNIPNKKYYDIWYHHWPISNNQLAKMWSRVLNIWPGILMQSADRISRKLPGSYHHIIPPTVSLDRDLHNLLDDSAPHLSFTYDEEKFGARELERIGVKKGAKFICLNVRDSAYLDEAMPWQRWDYQDYRDSDVNNYLLASEALTKRGYYVLRMGARVNKAFDTNNPMIIDYAYRDLRTDFMDIYIASKCHFCISTSTGFDALATIFRRPVLYTDFAHVSYFNSFSRKSMTLFKHHFLESKGRNMKLSEIIESGVGEIFWTTDYGYKGIKLINNSPDELTDASLEMDNMLLGIIDYSMEDLQDKAKLLFSQLPMHGEIRARVSKIFLHKDSLL